MMDELIIDKKNDRVILTTIPLVNAKNIFLVRAKEEDRSNNKSYVLNLLFMVGNELITTNYADTRLLLAELKLFERGNIQNTFTSIKEIACVVNLKLQLHNTYIYISKAEALTILDIYHESKTGISMQRLIENKYIFTAENLTKLLSNSDLLSNRGLLKNQNLLKKLGK